MEKLDLESFTRNIIFVGKDRTGNSRFRANACGGRKARLLEGFHGKLAPLFLRHLYFVTRARGILAML